LEYHVGDETLLKVFENLKLYRGEFADDIDRLRVLANILDAREFRREVKDGTVVYHGKDGLTAEISAEGYLMGVNHPQGVAYNDEQAKVERTIQLKRQERFNKTQRETARVSEIITETRKQSPNLRLRRSQMNSRSGLPDVSAPTRQLLASKDDRPFIAQRLGNSNILNMIATRGWGRNALARMMVHREGSGEDFGQKDKVPLKAAAGFNFGGENLTNVGVAQFLNEIAMNLHSKKNRWPNTSGLLD